MRVISGSARGTKLVSIDDESTKPTMDSVKESLFNIIVNDIDIIDSDVLDLFAGSGAIGIETLSRGARKAVFCDNSFEDAKYLKANLEKTHFDNEKSEIIIEDFKKCLEKLSKRGDKFDLIFLDPPYRKNLAGESCKLILSLDVLKKEGIIIIETDDDKRDLKEIENLNLDVYDNRKYGRIKLLFMHKEGN